MKKILFLLVLCIIKLCAYEYEIYNNYSLQIIYYDSENKLRQKYVQNGIESVRPLDTTLYLEELGHIRYGSQGYININVFNSYLKNDLYLLNGFYTTTNNTLQSLLNYYYNNGSFSAGNYIHYLNYEILYNDDGLAVESIVNGVWAGLYDDNQKTSSGALYDKNGSLVYYNGKEVTPVTSFLVWLQKFMNKVVLEAFEEMQRSFVAGTIAVVVLVLAIVRLVLELLPSSITPRRRRYYGGGGGGRRSLPDYGDGSQVAASVRARLAAKNRALKARAYDRSGLEQSLQNSILFDLENSDR